MQRFCLVSIVLTCSVVLGGQTSTLSFTNDARGAYPSTLTYSGGVITVDMSALPDGVQVYRAILVHDRGGNSGSFPPSNRSYQPLQVEDAAATGVWLQTVAPRHYHLDCTTAVQNAVSGNPKTLTLNVISFADLGSSPYIRVDVWCDQPAVHAIGLVTGIGARHQDGDTMITFTENGPFMTDPASTVGDYNAAIASTDSPDCVRYRIYRSSSPIDATGIRTAELVDEISPLSNWSTFYYNGNQYVTDADPCIRLPVDDETPSATDQGIYVRRAQAAGSAYYAVSKVVNGEEDLSNIGVR